jgi:hypothetical protein
MKEFGRAIAIPWHDSMSEGDKEPSVTHCWEHLRHNYDRTRQYHPEFGLSGICELREGPVQPEFEYEPCPVILPEHDACEECSGAGMIPVRMIPGRFVRLLAWYEVVEQ